MFTRRALLRALPALSLGSIGAGAGACRRETTTATTASSASTTRTKASWPRTSVHEGVTMIALFPNDADERSPLIVAIHGRGDRPDRWVDDWKRFPAKAQIALPQAFDPLGDGFSWFDFRDGMTDAQFGTAVGAAETRLWKAVAALAGTRQLIVTGFSQGGILSFAMAARHPDTITHAFPVAGACPGPLLPKERSRAAPVVAFHGTDDDVIQIKWGRETVHAFQEQGNAAELHEYPGIRHQMSQAIHRDLWSAIQKALPT